MRRGLEGIALMTDDGRRRNDDRTDWISTDLGDDSKADTGDSDLIKHEVGESGDTDAGRPQAKEGDDD